jgi:hypothetical protein
VKKIIIPLVIILTMLCSTVFASAAPDPDVVIVNPASNSTVHSNNLLISVKITQPKSITVKLYEEKQRVNGTLGSVNINSLANGGGGINKSSLTSVLVTSDNFKSTNNLSFYTRQVNGVNPGLYRVQIETKNTGGQVIYTTNSYFAVRERATLEGNIFETPQSGTLQFLQGLLRSIFGN